MTPKFVASEFSAKVKAYNLIEENILKQRLDGYRRQRKNNLRMIEKDSKKMQEKFLQSSIRISDTLQDDDDDASFPYLNDSSRGDYDLNDGNGKLETSYNTPNQTYERTTKKKRKKKSQKSSSKKNASSSMITRDTFLYKNETEIEPGGGKRQRSPSFLPKLHVTSGSEQLLSKPTKTTDNFSLPPINGSSLTSSVSLPSLHKFNKYGSHEKR